MLKRPNWLGVKPRDKNFLWLDKNENTDAEYLKWIKINIIEKVLPTDLSTYPDLHDFYFNLAEMENVLPDNLLLAQGSDGCIRAVFQTYVKEGDVVFITNPSFAMYDVYCKIFKAEAFKIEYRNVESEIKFNFNFLLENIAKKKPKLVCLPNPDSPTGTILSEAEILNLLLICKANNSILLIDEAYFPFYYYTSKVLINEFDNLIVCRTFSKAWGLAGIRVGYLLSNNYQIALMNLSRPMYEIGAIQLRIVEEIISYQYKMKESVNKIIEGKMYFEEQMKKAGLNVLQTFGNFSHVDFGNNKKRITDRLDKLVLYRKEFFHPALKGYSRFSSGPISIMKNVVEIIKKANEKI